VSDALLPLLLEDVTFRAAGKVLIDAVSTRISPGPPSLVLGPNGAGKSLLMRLCHGLIRPSSGRVRWQTESEMTARSRQAMVFQRPVLLRRSAEANVHYALRRARGIPRPQARQRARDALSRAGLSDLAKRPAHVLSGGEQQRLSLARAWSLSPQVLFLDEPTANLDPAGVRAVEDTIHAVAEDGVKIIMTTHDLGQARRMAGDVLFLHQGKLLEHESAEEFFAGPKTEPAQAFLEGRLLW
jgi:tungstate transport system ATP-binding protein